MTMQSSMGSWGFDVNRSTNGSTEHYRPTMTRQVNANDFASIDRLVLGPKNKTLSSATQSNEDLTMDNPPKTNHWKNELIAWQNRMLEKEQNLRPRTPNDFPTSQASTHLRPQSTRPGSAMSTTTDSQHFDHHHESVIKSARVIKRYIELLYHLQSFYQRFTDELFGGNLQLRNSYSSSISIYHHHCRRIVEQIQRMKPSWDEKLIELQNLLKDISNFKTANFQSEIAFLQRRSTLLNLMQTLSRQNELDSTSRSILSDIDRVIYEEKLALQLQDELLTLLQHQSLLNDFTSLLQWHRAIYSINDQNRLESLLPFLHEQSDTIDRYVSHVSQQLTELVKTIRSLEKYILSYTNTVPVLDDGNIIRRDGYSNPDDDDQRIRMRSFSSKTVDDPPRGRSLSMPRQNESERKIPSASSSSSASNKRTSNNLNVNNSNNNNNHHQSIPTSVATIRPTRRDQSAKPNGILKSSAAPRSSSIEQISDTDMNTIGADSLQWHEIDAYGKPRKIGSKLNSAMNYDSQFRDGDIPAPYPRRRPETISRDQKQNIHLQLAEEAKRKSEENARKNSNRRSYHERFNDYPNS